MENMNKLVNRTKLRHLLLLVSVISLCSSPFWWSPSSLLHYFNFYSSFASQILSHTIDKNCMFLICNGLLVFVGITGSFSSIDPPHHHHDHNRLLDHEDQETLQRCSSIEDTSDVEVKELMVDGEKEEDDCKKEEEEEEEEEDDEGKENGELGLDLKEEEDEGKENGELGLDLKEEEEEEEWLGNEEIFGGENVEEEDWRLSTEQMNKKFDDFIRRMKEDLRFEAKRQIVMV